LIGPSVGEL